jgi:hypothetical protein
MTLQTRLSQRLMRNTNFLKMQGKDIETKKGINKRALGYFDGFIYSAAKSQDIDVKHPYVSAIFIRLFTKLWGEEKGRRYLHCSLEFDDETRIGSEIGANDFLISSQTGNQPMGWFACFKQTGE